MLNNLDYRNKIRFNLVFCLMIIVWNFKSSGSFHDISKICCIERITISSNSQLLSCGSSIHISGKHYEYPMTKRPIDNILNNVKDKLK